MPDDETLAVMYGEDYARFFSIEESMSGAAGVHETLAWLGQRKPGTLIDYGCGAGYLLREAGKLGWKAIGIEFDRRIAARTSNESGALVVTSLAALDADCEADVLHLGDVIEHLTAPDIHIPQILGRLKQGGLLVAQGPLEGNPNLFLAAVRLAKRFRRNKTMEMAPYHVILSSAKGQRAFFRRFGLEEMKFSIQEVAWPAPARISLRDLRNPRAAALFVLRRLSQLISSLRSDCWGNRYFYVGRWNG